MREVFFAPGNFAGLLDPVFAERSLQAIDDRTADAESCIAPMLAVLRVALPLLRETEAADVPDATVDDHEFAVIAIVHATEIAETQRMERTDLYAGVLHQLRELAVHL